MLELTRLRARAANEVRSFDLEALRSIGLDRTLDSYYLIGPYPPLVAMQRAGAGVVEAALPALRQPVDLYVHFPFCRVSGAWECTFCHFYKVTHDRALETRFVDACLRELRMYQNRAGGLRVRSIYFGGGTFSLIAPENLRGLLRLIWRELDIDPSAEVKFEVHADAGRTPASLQDLLGTLREFAVTHLVVDIQTLNDESLRAISWARVRPDDYFRTLELCAAAGFEKIVTGLIVGLPLDSFESFLRSVLLVATLPQVVTVNLFPLMFRRGDAVHQQLRDAPELFPGVSERDLMHHAARLLLRGLGFSESPIYFMNRGAERAAHQTSKFAGGTLLGIGPSSFGMLGGEVDVQYYNVPSVEAYLRALDRGVLPIWKVAVLGEAARRVRHAILGFVNMNATLPRADLERDARVASLVEYFLELGMLGARDGDLSLTPKGLLRAEELSCFLAEDEVQQAVGRLDHPPDVERYSYFITRTAEQARRFRRGSARFMASRRPATALDVGRAHDA